MMRDVKGNETLHLGGFSTLKQPIRYPLEYLANALVLNTEEV